LGEFYERTELRTRVLVLDKDEKELHDSNEAARHLADRHDLRFAFTSDDSVMTEYDTKYKYLTMNKQRTGEYEALVVINHQGNKI
jgi:hypothetical protein